MSINIQTISDSSDSFSWTLGLIYKWNWVKYLLVILMAKKNDSFLSIYH